MRTKSTKLAVIVSCSLWVAVSLTLADEAGAVSGPAKQAVTLLLVSPEITLPTSLHYEAWWNARKKPQNVWLKFERDHAVSPDSGPFADMFYGLCVTTQKLKLLEKDLNHAVDRFDDSVSEALFGRDPGTAGRTPNGKSSALRETDFFGRPRFDTVTPLSRGLFETKSPSRLRDYQDWQRGDRDRIQVGFQIVIPFGR